MTRPTRPTLDDLKPPSLFVISPHYLRASTHSPRVVDGQLVDDTPNAFAFAAQLQSPDLSDDEIFRIWVGFHDTMPSGVEPVIADFLRDNPRYLGQNVTNGLGASKSTPRTWTSLSNLIQGLNSHVEVPGANGQWVAPECLVCGVVGQGPGLALLKYARDRGLEVLDTKPKNSSTSLVTAIGPKAAW